MVACMYTPDPPCNRSSHIFISNRYNHCAIEHICDTNKLWIDRVCVCVCDEKRNLWIGLIPVVAIVYLKVMTGVLISGDGTLINPNFVG